eukprot:840153-Amphidinium_carterae.1
MLRLKCLTAQYLVSDGSHPAFLGLQLNCTFPFPEKYCTGDCYPGDGSFIEHGDEGPCPTQDYTGSLTSERTMAGETLTGQTFFQKDDWQSAPNLSTPYLWQGRFSSPKPQTCPSEINVVNNALFSGALIAPGAVGVKICHTRGVVQLSTVAGPRNP